MPRGPRHSPLPVPEQDRHVRDATARNHPTAAARFDEAARAAPDPHLGKREAAVGFIDLALERAFVYRPQRAVRGRGSAENRHSSARRKHASTCSSNLPITTRSSWRSCFSTCLPTQTRVFGDLVKELREGLDLPGLLGSAENGTRHFPPAEGAAPRGSRPCTKRHRRLKVETAPSAAYCASRPSSRGTGASYRSPACSRASSPTARRSPGGDNADERIAGVFAVQGRGCRASVRWRGQATRWHWGRLEGIKHRRYHHHRQGRHRPDPGTGAAAAGARGRHRPQGPKGRGQAVGGPRQAHGGRSFPGAGAHQRHASGAAQGAGRDAPAGCARTARARNSA